MHEKDPTSERITVFSFDDSPELIQLLTHEFGHAVGIGHLADTGAIMYYLNYAGRGGLNASDLTALKQQCHSPFDDMLHWLNAQLSSVGISI